MTEPVRLSRRVAAQQGCSRSEAEQLIEGGWVRVDGVLVEEPQERVLPEQQVEIDPHAKPAPPQPVTLLLHKLAGEVVTAGPELRSPDDASGIRVLKRHFHRLAVPLPLPFDASGLAVLTQDGRMLRRLTEAASPLEEEWIVHVAGQAAPDAVQRLGRALRGKASVNSQGEDEARLRLAFKGLDPARVPALAADVGLRVLAMKRLRLGRLALGGLAPGRWRYLSPFERF